MGREFALSFFFLANRQLRFCHKTKQIIPLYYLCDGHRHCHYGDDEQSCTYTCNNTSSDTANTLICLRCSKSKYIPISLINNGIDDCPSQNDEIIYAKIGISRKAINSQVPMTEKCIYDRMHNRSISHCLFYECPYHFKCSNSYCIPYKHVCDSVYDCPDGADEELSMCKNLICYHMFKCVYGAHCLHPNKICDGYKDCVDNSYLGEDEVLCGADMCVPECICYGHTYVCVSTHFTHIPFNYKEMKSLYFRGNHLLLERKTFLFGTSLLFLDVYCVQDRHSGRDIPVKHNSHHHEKDSQVRHHKRFPLIYIWMNYDI